MAPGLRDTPRLGKRDTGITGVLKRVKAGHDIEASIRKREGLEVADAEVSARRALAGDRQKCLGRIDARYLSAQSRCHLHGHSRAATGIEITGTRLHSRAR